MTRPVVLTLGLAALATSAAAQDARGIYVATNLGLAAAADADATMFGANNPTRCDRLLYADPADAPTDAACAVSLASARQGLFDFDGGFGFAGAVALGYTAGGLRVEVELLRRDQPVDTAPFQAGNDVALVGKNTEWNAVSPPHGEISDFRSLQVFGNVYYDFDNVSAWTPYVGAGAGLATVDFDYSQQFLRKSLDEGYLEAFGGSRSDVASAPEWQRAAAGTISTLSETVSRSTFAYQLLGGIDRALSDRTTLGIKARWTVLGTVSAELPWTAIRSHRPVRADGSTLFVMDFDFEQLGYFTVAVEMRYVF